MARFQWDALVHPRGPLPPSVYWLRRLTLLLLVVVVAVAIAVVTARGNHSSGAAHASASPSPSPSGTSRSTPASSVPAPTTVTSSPPNTSSAANSPQTASPATASSSPTSLPACGSGAQLVLTTSAASYPAGTAPSFTATIKNTAPACAVPGSVTIVVYSGSDRIWSNADCRAGTANSPSVTVPAGGTRSVAISWQRNRTASGCATVNGAHTAAPGTYRATATWGALTSGEVVLTLR